jgi:mannose-6-phosphate isomerase-like protein (cupin superfamily)
VDRFGGHHPRAGRRPNDSGDGRHNTESDQRGNWRLEFLEVTSPPGTGPPRHIHHSCDELFYVLEGEFLFLVGERQVGALPGTFVFIPRGTVHAAKVIGTEPGKVLAAYIPGGLGAVLRRVRQAADRAGRRRESEHGPGQDRGGDKREI